MDQACESSALRRMARQFAVSSYGATDRCALGASEHDKKLQLNELFALNRPTPAEGCLLKESLGRRWTYTYEGAMVRLSTELDRRLRWQGSRPMEKLGRMLLDHLL